jgi:hypothetical protein
MKLSRTLLSATLAGAAICALPTANRLNGSGVPRGKQEEKSDAKETKMQGQVVRVYADLKTIDLHGGTTAKSNEIRKIAYDDSTLWTNMGKPGKKEDVKEGSFIIVVGRFQKDGTLLASRIDLRLPR